MAMKFITLSPATEDDPCAEDVVELETKRSAKLRDLLTYFIAAEQPFFRCHEIRLFGVDVIALRDINSLSSEGRYFRKLDSLGSTTAAYPSDDTHYKVRKPLPIDVREKPIISVLHKSKYMLFSGLPERPLPEVIQKDGYWNPIFPQCTHKFFGIYCGMYSTPNLTYGMASISEWIGPTFEEGNLNPPHLKIYMTTACNGADTILTQGEIYIIMSSFYNRVYEPGYEGHSVFPILLISEYYWRRVRIIEAVFDQPRDKFSIRFTPICDFTEKDELLWNIFLRYEGSEPQPV